MYSAWRWSTPPSGWWRRCWVRNLQGWLMQPWLIASFAGLFVLLSPHRCSASSSCNCRRACVIDWSRPAASTGAAASPGTSALGVLSGLLMGPCADRTAGRGAAVHRPKRRRRERWPGAVRAGPGDRYATGAALVTVGNRFLPKPGPWMDRVKVSFGTCFWSRRSACFVRCCPTRSG